jgi:protein-S-isoprenylcysteine O-methyltransferase Ste14
MKNKIPPPVILLLFGIAMWFVAHSELAYAIAIPHALVVAIVLAAVAVLIAGSAIRQFGAAETTVNPLKPDTASALVQTGIFGKTRNPMYLGLLVALCGWAIWLQSLSNVGVLVAFVIVIYEMQIKPEEAALRKLFGEDYERYCQKVRRWI